MKRNSSRLARGLIVLAAAVLGWSAPPAVAQDSFALPAPQMQGQPTAAYRPRATPRPTAPQHNVVTLPVQATPAPAPTPAPPSPPPAILSRPAQPMLPAVFRGCWSGEVAALDSIERLPGAPPIGYWTPKTYRMCYTRVGDGPFRLTFTEAGIQRNRMITNAQGAMDVLSTDGRTYATLRALLHFDEYHSRGYFTGATFPVDEVTKLQCQIEPDGMHVIGSVYGMRNTSPWFRAYWHAVFVHVPG